jgi:hypothetical protein
VLIVERWLLGRLRRKIFYSLVEVNAAIGEMCPASGPLRQIGRIAERRISGSS